MCGKCASKGKGLCPVSFGVALGLTVGLAVFICAVWMMTYGIPPTMLEHHWVATTVGGNALIALIAAAKGFVFGLVLAIIYDLIICCCKCRCCRKECDPSCDCKTDKKC